jgi:hypothetical protein
VSTTATHTDPKQAAWFRAIDHARLTGTKPLYNIAGDYYTVTSPRTSRRYIVRRVAHGTTRVYSCTCPAYLHAQVCWHRALVMALPYELGQQRQPALEDYMKLELKVAGGKIKDAGYYTAMCTDAAVVANGKLDDQGQPESQLELNCAVEYDGDEVAVKTVNYLTLGPTSRLTQLLIATSYAPDYDGVVARYEREGLDSDALKGKRFRILYTSVPGKDGRPWIKDSGYAPLSKKQAAAPQADDDVAF